MRIYLFSYIFHEPLDFQKISDNIKEIKERFINKFIFYFFSFINKLKKNMRKLNELILN